MMEEQVGVMIDNHVVLPADVILKKGANKLIKWTTTVKSWNHLPCQLTTMRKGRVKITILQQRLMA